MNINLKNRTIFTKILLGFVLLLVLAALMAGVLFYSLGSVIGALRQITEQNAPSIRYPTGVERYALRAILNEKTYLLLEKKEIHEQAQRDIQETYANLDRMDEVAAKYSDQGLLQKSRDVRRAVERYRGSYNRGIDLIKENQRLAHTMRIQGTRVYDLSHAHTLEHKRLLEKAITDGVDQKKYMGVLLLCNEIEKETLEARGEEGHYLLNKKQEHFEKLKRHIAGMMKLLKEVSRVDYVLEHQPLIEETRRSADKYLRAIEKWIANDNELREMLAEMHKMGLKVQETAQAIQEAGWEGMDTNKAIAIIKTKGAIITGTLVAVITLITGILAAFFIARGIAGPIKELKRATGRIAEGDLRHRLRIKASDEIGELSISFNKMSESLQNTMISRDYFDNIIKSMIDTLIVLDKEAKIQTVNPATCYLLGYTEEELIGQPASILFAEEEEEEVYRVFQFFREPEKAEVIHPQDTIRNRELTYKTKDGRLIPMLFNASVICDKTGNITGVVAGAKDITDLKLAEVAIRKEKTFSENIIATIPDPLLVLDKDLRIKKANRSFYKVFGTEHEKVIGARITDILGDEDGRLSTRLSRLLGTKDNIEQFELHYQSEKRGKRIFSITARNIIFAEEEEEEELLVITDITERKRAEEALRESEEKYRSLVNNIKLGIFRSTLGPSGKFIEVNLAMEEITGYSREELLSMNVSDLYMRSEERETVVAEVATATGKTTRELNFRKKDGAEMVVSDRKVAVRDNTGKVLYFDGIIEDITGRKRAEEALKQSEEETRRLAQETAIISEIGRIISSTLNIEEVYERFADELCKVLPFDRVTINIVNVEENIVTVPYVAGIPVTERQPGEYYPLAGSFAEEVIRTRKAIIYQLENENEVANRFPGLLPVFRAGLRSTMMVPLISKGQAIGVLHILSKKPDAYNNADLKLAKTISAQIAGAIANAQLFRQHKQDAEVLRKAYAQLEQTQAQLIQAEKAEVIGRLATGVAHEVKNPLAIIMQGIDYLSAIAPLNKANVSLTLKHMNDAVKRADNITKGLLSFSRAGEIKKMPENLNSIIEGSLFFLKNLLDKYHIEVIKELGKDILSLNLDKGRIEQVFLNLFLNAIDAMPAGGQIKVRTYNEEMVGKKVRHGAGETAVIAEIEDTGTGIPEDILDKIFDPFFTTKRDKGGTGLGLPIVRNIVEMHNGEIKIENRKDKSGVRVSIWFKS